MKNKLLSIGQMAKMNHTTVPTLRLYDQLGLLHPRYTEPETSYRYYDIRQNARFDLIQYMKELGMSLDEIQRVLKKEDLQLVENILIKKREQVFAQIRQLRIQRDAITRAIASIERYRKSPAQGAIVLEYIDRRYVWGVPCARDFYQQGFRAFEQELSTLRKALMERGFTHAHSYNVGTSISGEDFSAGRFVPKDTFVFVGYRDQSRLPETLVVDSGMYACIYLSSFDEELACAEKLRRHCMEQNWTVCGDYFCEIMTEFNVFDDDRRSMFLRLQVPVRFD